MDTITIKIPAKHTKEFKKNESVKAELLNYNEVHSDYLKHLHGSWIKFLDLNTNLYNSGGFLSKIDLNVATFRVPASKDEINVNIDDKIFYVKKDNENYIALQDFLVFKEHIKYNEQELQKRENNLEKQTKFLEQRILEFEKLKKNFFKENKHN